MARAVQWLCIAAGSVSLSLGIVGVFVPILPTTPFLLLAAWCYARGSRRLHSRLLGHRRLGPFIRNYLNRRGMRRGTKIATLALLWSTITVSAVCFVPYGAWTVVLGVVAVGVTIHLLTLPTLDGQEPER